MEINGWRLKQLALTEADRAGVGWSREKFKIENSDLDSLRSLRLCALDFSRKGAKNTKK
jgi:hypothetical protein